MSVEKHTIDGWGSRLNAPGEPLTISEAMLLSLGHLNARSEAIAASLLDIQIRLTRIELFLQETIPNYDRVTRRAALRLVEEEAGRGFDPGTKVPRPPQRSNESVVPSDHRGTADG